MGLVSALMICLFYYKVRLEKLELATLLERVPIPVKQSVEEPAGKIDVLL